MKKAAPQAKVEQPMTRIYNSSKQMIPIQLRPPGSDFYRSEMQVRVSPGESVLVPKSHVNEDQINNLRKRRLIRITYGDK